MLIYIYMSIYHYVIVFHLAKFMHRPIFGGEVMWCYYFKLQTEWDLASIVSIIVISGKIGVVHVYDMTIMTKSLYMCWWSMSVNNITKINTLMQALINIINRLMIKLKIVLGVCHESLISDDT